MTSSIITLTRKNNKSIVQLQLQIDSSDELRHTGHLKFESVIRGGRMSGQRVRYVQREPSLGPSPIVINVTIRPSQLHNLIILIVLPPPYVSIDKKKVANTDY